MRAKDLSRFLETGQWSGRVTDPNVRTLFAAETNKSGLVNDLLTKYYKPKLDNLALKNAKATIKRLGDYET
jgi:hypothetical protein